MRSISFVRTVFHSFIISILLSFYTDAQDLQGPKISLKVDNMPLGDVLQVLEPKINFTFSYINEELPLKERVSLEINNEPLQKILEILSERFALTFNRINNIITIKQNEENKIVIDEKNIRHSIGTLRGIVRDSATSEVLPNVNIYIQEIKTGASTDNRGFFIIPSIPANKEYTITITYVGYSPKNVNIIVQENRITNIDIYISESVYEKESILVTGKRIDQVEVTAQKISMNEIENMSIGVETDVMRAIQILPGVQSAGDVSARYYVRGGASNENLVLMNGVPIYNPFHALGIFSVIDPDIINGIEFYKGGFGARYGGRLSSVMDIITKDGNRKNFGATAAASQLTIKTSLEGPVPNGSFIITGRKSYSNEILKKFTNNKSVPIDFYDASFRTNYTYYESPAITKFTLFGFISKDKINYKEKMHSNFYWSNSNVGVNIFSAMKNSPLFAEFTIYYSEFEGGEIPVSGNTHKMENGVNDFSIKGDLNYVLSDRNEYYGGIISTNLKTKLLLLNSSGVSKDIGSEGFSLCYYGGFKLNSINNLKVDLGSRLNIMKLTEGSSLSFEPRVNVLYSLLPTLNLKAAWGIYQQELVTISDEDEVLASFEPWIVTPNYRIAPSAIHYIGGLDYYLTEKLKINVEGYHKVMHNLCVLNDNVIFPSDPQLINGSGKSFGGEITMNYNAEWISTQLSYAYSNTTKKVKEIEFHPRYDSRNSIKLFVNCELGNNWTAGISWDYNSGTPFTQILGYYNMFNPSDILSPSSIFSNYTYFPILADRNAAHLPDYHKMDMNVSKKLRLGFMDLSISVSIMNIYDRKNFFYFDTETGERVNMLPFFPSIDVKVEL